MPLPVSSARAFWDHIEAQADPFGYLKSIADSTAPHYPFFEEEWLDFKGHPNDEKDAKEKWSKALSGYANITDGLIIWGIDARKTGPRNIDAACGLRLIPDPSAFESKLRDWIRDATNPPVMGVEYQTYPGPNGEGFVVCLIQESTHKPHRAEWAKKHYYYRAGDDFLMAEPGLLRTLFFPQRSCQIRVELGLKYRLYKLVTSGHPYVYTIWLTAKLLVEGSSAGRDVYLRMSHKPNLKIRVAPGSDWSFRGYSNGKAGFQAIRPLHPGEEVQLLDDSETEGPFTLREIGHHLVLRFTEMLFDFEMYIADQERRVQCFRFDEQETMPGEGEATILATLIEERN
jgi:hypothetical protein